MAELPSAEIARAVIHNTRIAILVLCGGSRTMPEIREKLDLTRGAARYHVEVLMRAGLLREGPRGYRSAPGWSDFLVLLEGMAERHAGLSERLAAATASECSGRARRRRPAARRAVRPS